MKSIFCTAILAAMCTVPVMATGEPEVTDEIVRLDVDARLDYQRDWNDGHVVDDNTGFEGKYLVIRVDGAITGNLSYSWRQRLNKNHNDGSFFDATDWVYLNYNINDRWSVAGGKQVVAIGGWEYDRAPIDLYGCSVFWNNIPCYQIGASATYRLTGSDRLSFQFCESPFFRTDYRDMYAYNLMWSGSHGLYSSLWSANLIEYAPKRYITYLALGNRFDFGKVALELDLMNRAASRQAVFFKDWSLMAELSYRPTAKWNLHLKGTYDRNATTTGADLCVLAGTKMTMLGGGLEYFPLVSSKHTLRLHANCYYSTGTNANPGDVMQDKTVLFDLGVKWSMNILSLKRK